MSEKTRDERDRFFFTSKREIDIDKGTTFCCPKIRESIRLQVDIKFKKGSNSLNFLEHLRLM